MILILVGPKGSGKSHVGETLEARLDVPFLRVEELWLSLRGRVPPERFEAAGQALVEAAIAARLARDNRVCVESTAAAPWFAAHLERLRALGDVRLAAVVAPREVCLARIKARDASRHLPASDGELARYDAASRAAMASLRFDARLDNASGAADGEIVAAFLALLQPAEPPADDEAD